MGLGGFFYKWKVLRFPVQPVAETEVYELQARVEFQPRRGPNKVTLQLPYDPPGFAILGERFVGRNYCMTIERAKGAREVQWAIRRASGTQALYYRATVYRDQHREAAAPKAPPPPKPGTWEEPFATARSALLEQVHGESIDSATFAGALVRRLAATPPSQEVQLLLEGRDTIEQRAELALSLLADRLIAARLAWGLPLAESSSSVALRPLLQVFDRDTGQWITIAQRTGSIGWPDDTMLWSIGPKPVLEVDNNPRALVEFSVQKSLADALETAKQRLEAQYRNFVAYSLLDLPLRYEPFRIEDSSDCVQIANAASDAVGLKPHPQICDCGLDANWMAAHEFPTVTLGCGQHDIHTVKERLHVPDYLAAWRVGLRFATGT